MFPLLYILIVFMAATAGGLITYMWTSNRWSREFDSILEKIKKVGKSHKETIEVADKLINAYRKAIVFSYDELVTLRDAGHEDLDEVIGELGKVLDY